MAGRGPSSFNKRQKEQKRKDKQQEKFAKRMEKKQNQAATANQPSGSGQAPDTSNDPELETESA